MVVLEPKWKKWYSIKTVETKFRLDFLLNSISFVFKIFWFETYVECFLFITFIWHVCSINAVQDFGKIYKNLEIVNWA